MMSQRIGRTTLRVLLTLCGGGLLLAQACVSDEMQQAIVAGLETVATRWLDSQNDDDISFGDWLESEFNF